MLNLIALKWVPWVRQVPVGILSPGKQVPWYISFELHWMCLFGEAGLSGVITTSWVSEFQNRLSYVSIRTLEQLKRKGILWLQWLRNPGMSCLYEAPAEAQTDLWKLFSLQLSSPLLHAGLTHVQVCLPTAALQTTAASNLNASSHSARLFPRSLKEIPIASHWL